MSEHREPSTQRLFALTRYISALEQGDLETLTAVLNEASHDRVLCTLLEEVDMVYQDIDHTTVSASEIQQAFQCLAASSQRHRVQNETTQRGENRNNGWREEQATLPLPRLPHCPQPPVRQSTSKRGRLLAALLVACCLIGALVFTWQKLYPNAPTRIGGLGTATPSTATTTNWGKIIYRGLYDPDSTGMAIWSPDSQRIATREGSGIQIWDATTGNHPITLSLTPPTGPPTGVNFIAWSPDGKWLALAVTNGILIVDSQTGTIVHTFPLSAIQSDSGGSSISMVSVNWSPDGRLLAVTLEIQSTTFSEQLKIINAQTGLVVHNFSNPGIGGTTPANWSPDGKYLVAGVQDNAEQWTTWVWDASTYNKIIQIGIGDGQDLSSLNNPLIWQGQSDNLAFIQSALTIPGNQTSYPAIVLWDVAHSKLIRQYDISVISGLFTLSPDGKYLAVKSSEGITILDMQNGQSTYVYHLPRGFDVASLAWSPNGQYIVAEAGSNPTPILVLGAE